MVLIGKKGSGKAVEKRGKSRKSSGNAKAVEREAVASSRKATKHVVKKKGFDIADLVDKYYDQLYSYLGLETLSVDRSFARRIIEEILSMLYRDASSKPALDAIFKKIDRFRQEINGLIAYRLATELKDISSGVLDFIVYNGGKFIVSEIGVLYRLANRLGRSDLIPVLVSIWEKSGNATPVKCPKCGFRSIYPDQSCRVCGYVVTEDYIRRELGFEDKLRVFVSIASDKDLQDVKELGVVLVSDRYILNPKSIDIRRYTGLKPFYQVSLRKSDYLLIIEEINKRRSST